MLLHPTSHVAAMEASTCAGAGEAEAACNAKPFCWSNLVTEYMFEPPGMPVERKIDHKIELEPGAASQYQRQYCVSAAKLAKVWY